MLAACTAGAEEAPTDRRSETPASPTPEPEPVPEVGPVSAFLSTLRALTEESDEQIAERMAAVEAVVAACMADQGFEYVPVEFRPRDDDDASAVAPPSVDPVEAAEEHGYGIATAPTGPPEGAPASEWVDLNGPIVEAMSSAERSAYYLALGGEGQGEAYVQGEEPYDWTKYGCSGRAQHEVPGAVRPQFDMSAFGALDADIQTMWGSVADDPRLVPVVEAWSQCMAEAGYPGMTHVEQPRDEISAAAELIWQETYGSLVVDVSSDDYMTSPAYLEAKAETERRLAELATTEIPLAAADARCAEETGYWEARGQAALDAEKAFYAAREGEFEAWRQAYEEFAAGQGS
ncbi:hypothetical protein ICW40_03705 [Actinotalea ferrariae]|uniref:hypothetical protein n=1 Tax=Actinotalea ferrariae TaxID=1386098 RepID=UPI001C8C876A|nr:hypothetical protein [Actinotalea ferrariae]MBX9243911.1 hypothetical protein [Actinotalea ferrariae]